MTAIEVGRCLNRHLGPKHISRGLNRPEQVVDAGFRESRHLGPGFCSKILDYYFLNMAEFRMQLRQRFERLDALLTGLSDADEDAGRKRNLQFAGKANILQSQGRRVCLANQNVDHRVRKAGRTGSRA